jgi:hypothetical protein
MRPCNQAIPKTSSNLTILYIVGNCLIPPTKKKFHDLFLHIQIECLFVGKSGVKVSH